MAATPLPVRDQTAAAGHDRARPPVPEVRSRFDSALDDLAEVGEPLNWSDVVSGWPDDVDLGPTPDLPEEAEPAKRIELGGTPRRPASEVTGGYPTGTPWASPPGAVPIDRPPAEGPAARPPAKGAADRLPAEAAAGRSPAGAPKTDRPPAVARAVDRPPQPPPTTSRRPAETAATNRPQTGPATPLDSDVDPFPTHLGDFMDEAGPFRSYRESTARPAGPERRPLPPPAWVLPEPETPLPGPPSSADAVWQVPSGPIDTDRYPDDEEPALSTAGAFGADSSESGRRFGLGAFDPGRRGVKALAVVAVVVIVVAAFLAWRARPQVDTVAPPSFGTTGSPAEGSAGAPGPGPGAGAGAGTSGVSAAPEVVVAVGGKVRKPGLVRLPPGARVADALSAAGGTDPGVDVAMLNLARKVVDGELILVGVTPPPGVVVPTGPAAPGGAGPAGGLVNLNTATLADLDTLPGVGPVLAQRILDARDAQGGFKSVSDLRKVDGIGDARYEQLKDLVTV
jgi:competence protein ComEA